MTKYDFERKTPGLIRHKSHGVQYLEIRENKDSLKAFYVGENNITSFSTYASSWEDLFQKMSSTLSDNIEFLENPPFEINS